MRFENVIGQKDLKKKLLKEVENQKISHAQMFLGDPGLGALPLAIAFAQYILCEDKQENDSCGVCPTCRQVQEIQHPDLHFSFPTIQSISKVSNGLFADWRTQIQESPYFSSFDWIKKIDPKEGKPIISVHESVEIQKKLRLKSYQGGYKILIMWLPETMNIECANKILKVLEEPPEKTLFLLVSADADALLDTIRSRCQVLQLQRIENELIGAHLKKTFNMDEQKCQSITSFSEGNLLKAYEIAQASDDDEALKDAFIDMMRSSYKKNVIEMMNWSDAMAKKGKERQKIFLTYTLHMLRQCIVKNYMGEKLVKVSKEEAAFIERFSPFVSGKNIREFMKAFDEAYYQLERNANSKILFTLLCFQSMRFLHK
ncbi:MAG: DNA polymerase III subunit delta [Crocinitomicaceae bacterium]|nr:DNA polymerase III subunit delta [Crocinitomicaceae bacterium]